MFHIVLHEPEIPPNTGNIIRLCANTGAHLHLIKPLGFALTEKSVQRAGMDYRELADVKTWGSLGECLGALAPTRWFAVTTKGEQRYAHVSFEAGDVFVFGPETRGLPASVLESCPPQRRLRIPMRLHSRSINLSNAAAIVLYEAWRQVHFADGA